MIDATQPAAVPALDLDRMDVVVVGHVDHGKSTVIGRLMADTGSLPEGKLEQVKSMCARNARPFEYAFLLDALKNEQAQGITIDTARCFFTTPNRHYIIHDAPGHVEFLKNMITGASRAQAALLVIDAHEGVAENSKRHGYILSLLGIRQVAVLLNKMDLVGWDRERYDAVRDEYSAFLAHLGVQPLGYIPIAAREGANITARADEAPWYDGPTVLEQIEAFKLAEDEARTRPFRMPVQDVYKFTAEGDDRRIVAGTIESGELSAGDDVLFLPSGKRSTVNRIEVLQGDAPTTVGAEEAVGFTLTTQVYVRPGELVVKAEETPGRVGRRFSASLFWMAHAPLVTGKRYGLKLGATRATVELVSVTSVLDASELTSIEGKQQIDRHEVGECVLETARPVAFDLSREIEKTARFVIVDGYDIAACGVVLEQLPDDGSLLAERAERRENTRQRGDVTPAERLARYGHAGKAVVFVGSADEGTASLARALERRLFERGTHAYYLGPGAGFGELADGGGTTSALQRDEDLRQLGELARVMTDAGLLFITAIESADEFDLETLRVLNAPSELFVVRVGQAQADGEAGVELPANAPTAQALDAVEARLGVLGILTEYSI